MLLTAGSKSIFLGAWLLLFFGRYEQVLCYVNGSSIVNKNDLGTSRNQMTTWHHSSLVVTNLDLAISFYSAAFEFQVEFEERGIRKEISVITGISGLACDLVQLRRADTGHLLELIAFHYPENISAENAKTPVLPGMAHIAFTVEDFDSVIGKVERLGAKRVGDVAYFPEGRSAYYREPAGSFFEIEQLDP